MTGDFIFDLDGTLVDSLPGIKYSIDAALVGTQHRKGDLRAMVGPPIRVILRALVGVVGEEQLNEVEQLFRSSYDSEGWRKTVCYSGAKEMLNSLHAKGSRLFLVTNKPSQATEKILDVFEMRRYFEDVLTPDSRNPAFQGKAEMLSFLIRRHGIAIEASLLVGDTAEDCVAAEAVGIAAVIVAHGYGGQRVAAEFPHCLVIEDLSQISSDCILETRTL